MEGHEHHYQHFVDIVGDEYLQCACGKRKPRELPEEMNPLDVIKLAKEGNEDIAWTAPKDVLLDSIRQLGVKNKALEQRLAEAQVQLGLEVQAKEMLMNLIDQQQRLAEARALLSESVDDWARYMRPDDTSAYLLRCKLCDFPTDTGDPAHHEGEKLITQHYPGCLIAHWRAFLAK
jgi:hypothetical protein